MNNRGFVSAVSIAAFSMAGAALAKPPLQLAGPGVRVEPLAIAPVRIENGKFVFGAWQEYAPVQSRGTKGYYYVFDCFGGYVFDDQNPTGYVNHAHGGRGAALSDVRTPGESPVLGCGLGSVRWWFGESYNCPLNVEDIQSLAPGAQGGSPIDGIDVAWWWGGGDCVLVFLTSDDSALCENGDPLDHAYHEGVAVSLGELEPNAEHYYFVNINGIWSQNGVLMPVPNFDGSYLAGLAHADGEPARELGTQLAIWGTGDANGEPFRAGTQREPAWDDDAPTDGLLTENECYWYNYVCPTPNGKCVGFLGLRCPADVNWDGFVNADDYDLFADWFDAGWTWDRRADLNGNGVVTVDDFDAFVEWVVEGC